MSRGTVSVVIATYNRQSDLAVCLEHLKEQTRIPDEVIVIDDGSDPEACPRIPPEGFPCFQRIRFHRNRGNLVARNVGIATASGEYILSLDDDSWLVDSDGLARALDRIRTLPDAGCLALNSQSCGGGSHFPAGAPSQAVPTYVNCAALLRREAVIAAGMYAEELHFMGEEEDLSIRLYDLGYRVISCPDILVYHAESPRNRSSSRTRLQSERSSLMRELLRCPGAMLPYRFFRTWTAHAMYNVKKGFYFHDLRILFGLGHMLATARRGRKPVSVEAYRRWRGVSEAP